MKAFYLIAIVLAAAIAATPPAAAHECANHDPAKCDAGNCPDGEYHQHVDYNDDTEDEFCASEPNPPTGDCQYYGMTHPPVVCSVLRLQPPVVVNTVETAIALIVEGGEEAARQANETAERT